MKKFCSGCGQERDEQDFNWKYKDRGIRQSRCKSCMSRVAKQHYKNNKQSYIDRNFSRRPLVREDNRKRITAYLASHPCVDCSTTDMRVLEFDHVHGEKSGHIARMVENGYSWPTIESEIDKCDVRCANCHRIKTSSTNNRTASWRHFFASLVDRPHSDPNRSLKAMRKAQKIVENQQLLYTFLSKNSCVDCGNSDIRVLEFDHVRGMKYNDVGRLLTNGVS